VHPFRYTKVAFSFAAPFGLHFDKFAFERGEPRLFVTDFHRVLQIDLDPASFPVAGVPGTGRRMIVTPLGMSEPSARGSGAAAVAVAASTQSLNSKKKTPSAVGRISASQHGRQSSKGV
jgi:hypothetical protein